MYTPSTAGMACTTDVMICPYCTYLGTHVRQCYADARPTGTQPFQKQKKKSPLPPSPPGRRKGEGLRLTSRALDWSQAARRLPKLCLIAASLTLNYSLRRLLRRLLDI